PEHRGRLVDGLPRAPVAAPGGFEEIGDPALSGGGPAGVPARGQGPHVGQGPETAARPEVALDELGPEAHEADLAGQRVVASVELAPHHDAGSDPHARPDERAGVVSPRGAAPALAQDGEVY